MIKLTIPGRPISKSNFKLHNVHGQAWMPSTGKHSKYLAYENMIAGFINQQYFGETIEEDLITILNGFTNKGKSFNKLLLKSIFVRFLKVKNFSGK